ncbi:MAG: glycosyltransferase [Saprospiraceae bacterium]|nr:glycosyltransferase [Saprospiraceae bacterium]
MEHDVVFFSLFRTDNPYSSISLSMAKELAKNVRVLYVNHPYSWKDIFAGLKNGDSMLRQRLWHLLSFRNRYEHLDAIPENFVAITPPPTLPINWLPPGKIYDFFQRLNNGIVLRSIGRAVRKYNFYNFLFINCYDPFYAGWLPAKMGAKASIYHCVDDITQNAYTARHGERLENDACRNADLVFVTSTNLKRLKEEALGREKTFTKLLKFSKRRPKASSPPRSDDLESSDSGSRIFTFFNAAEVSVFHKVFTEKYQRPAELKDRPGQVIGFIGNLDELRIDYALLKKIALHFPEKTLLLVGPVNSLEPAEIGLDKLPNVVFAGSRRLEELPPLVQYMDCALIPFLCNTLTFSIYPLKINEYLAAGKPVVTTSFSNDIRTFAHCTYLAESHEEFLQKIETALAENNAYLVQIRTEVANSNTWGTRIKQLWQEVETINDEL